MQINVSPRWFDRTPIESGRRRLLHSQRHDHALAHRQILVVLRHRRLKPEHRAVELQLGIQRASDVGGAAEAVLLALEEHAHRRHTLRRELLVDLCIPPQPREYESVDESAERRAMGSGAC